MLVKLGKRAWLHCDDCRHSIMIEPHELAQRHRLDMQNSAAHHFKGDALHTLRSAERMLLAGAAIDHPGLSCRNPDPGLALKPCEGQRRGVAYAAAARLNLELYRKGLSGSNRGYST